MALNTALELHTLPSTKSIHVAGNVWIKEDMLWTKMQCLRQLIWVFWSHYQLNSLMWWEPVPDLRQPRSTLSHPVSLSDLQSTMTSEENYQTFLSLSTSNFPLLVVAWKWLGQISLKIWFKRELLHITLMVSFMKTCHRYWRGGQHVHAS